MKKLTALLLASGMAVTMVPSIAVAQESATMSAGSTLEAQLDGATLEQIAAATTAVIVYVDEDFDLSMSPANIDDVRAAIDENAAVSLVLDSREVDTPDIVGVAAHGEGALLIFVAQDAADENSLTGTMNDEGMVDVEGDIEGEIDADVDVDSDTDATVDGDTDASAEGTVDGSTDATVDDEDDTNVNVGSDTDASADADSDTGVSVDGDDATANSNTGANVDSDADVNVNADEDGVAADAEADVSADVESETDVTVN